MITVKSAAAFGLRVACYGAAPPWTVILFDEELRLSERMTWSAQICTRREADGGGARLRYGSSMSEKQTGRSYVGVVNYPAVFSWDSSLVGVAKFARYACLAFNQFAFDVPRYWSLQKQRPTSKVTHEGEPIRQILGDRLEGSIIKSLPSLGVRDPTLVICHFRLMRPERWPILIK